MILLITSLFLAQAAAQDDAQDDTDLIATLIETAEECRDTLHKDAILAENQCKFLMQAIGPEEACQFENGWGLWCQSTCGYCKKDEEVDLKWNEWYEWSPCTLDCNVHGGEQTRFRGCNHGTISDCESSGLGRWIEKRPCYDCPLTYEFKEWGDWGVCVGYCEDAKQMRVRGCNHGEGRHCQEQGKGVHEDQRPCLDYDQLDAICFAYENWAQWGACDEGCGKGSRTRHRKCNLGGVENCEGHGLGSSVDKNVCTEDNCIHDMDLSIVRYYDWGDWEQCSSSCGFGTQHRQRKCTTGDIQDCVDEGYGYLEEYKICENPACLYDECYQYNFKTCMKTPGCWPNVLKRQCTTVRPVDVPCKAYLSNQAQDWAGKSVRKRTMCKKLGKPSRNCEWVRNADIRCQETAPEPEPEPEPIEIETPDCTLKTSPEDCDENGESTTCEWDEEDDTCMAILG